MHPLQAVIFVLSSGWLARARLLYSGPEDLYASPKSRVTFLNDFPVSNDTARRWLREGLKRGEREFLDDSLETDAWHPRTLVGEIGGSELESFQPLPQDCTSLTVEHTVCNWDYFDRRDLAQRGTSNHTLEHMKMGPDTNFLCLIPPPRDSSPVPEELDRSEVIRNGWSLLQPLTGKCLYV
ncbi:hypothetical protein PISMIDRAFT_20407 [Pisolithus microcarpus 441]|uniref:Uncharacterized protein n=1 Tax=Pisolithus microcarpus 441 TaxID=765257 RepID=A0A0C9XDS5_9AGAM|nr:hypothetical protein PISMIDRAFT_20407 [Pisolithus microcarpus 441]